MATWSENKNTPKPFTIYLNHDLNILNHYGCCKREINFIPCKSKTDFLINGKNN